MGEAGILRLAVGPAGVDLLEDDGEFEAAQDFMIGQVGEAAAGLAGPGSGEFGTGEPGGGGGMVPVGEGEAEVDEGVADCRHLPIEDGGDLGAREDDVVEFVVVVDEGRGGFRGKVGFEVVEHTGGIGRVGGGGAAPAVGPAGDLAGNEAGGFAEGGEGGIGEGDGVELDEGIDEGLGEGGGVGVGVGFAEDEAGAGLHQEEGGSEEGGIVAEG